MRVFHVWLDSGANIASTYETTVSLEDLGCSEEEFEAMSDSEKDAMFKDVAWERMDWGWREQK